MDENGNVDGYGGGSGGGGRGGGGDPIVAEQAKRLAAAERAYSSKASLLYGGAVVSSSLIASADAPSYATPLASLADVSPPINAYGRDVAAVGLGYDDDEEGVTTNLL